MFMPDPWDGHIVKRLLIAFLRDETGATAMEYGLIAAGIAIVIITAVNLVGTNLKTTFNKVASAVTSS
jgi:pilus assembly protein Flp/PilA